MRKAGLIAAISDKTGIEKVDVLVTLETMFKQIKQSVIAGESTTIRGFGTFIAKKRKATTGRNIRDNTAIQIPEHFVPAFKPGKEFLKEVRSNLS